MSLEKITTVQQVCTDDHSTLNIASNGGYKFYFYVPFLPSIRNDEKKMKIENQRQVVDGHILLTLTVFAAELSTQNNLALFLKHIY